MRGVLFLLGTWRRRRRAALAGVALLGAVSLGFVLLAGLGAHRSGTGWESLRRRTLDGDAILDVTSFDAALRVSAGARRVPGVAEAVALALAPLVPEGRADLLPGALLTLEPGGFEEVMRPVITAGRRANQGLVEEVVVNEVFVEVAGLGPGDRFTMVDPLGLVSQEVTIVGVGVVANDFSLGAGYPVAYPTIAFTQAWEAPLRQIIDDAFGAAVFVTHSAGADGSQVRARLIDSVPGSDLVEVSDVSVTAAQVVDTLRLQRNGYLALAVVGGVATLSILALVLARVTRTQPTEANALAALGFTGRDLRLAVLVPGALAAAAALVGATVVVALSESLVPTGLAHRVGAGRDVSDDAGFFAVSTIGAAAALASLVAAVAWRATREVSSAAPPARPRSGALAWPSVGAGLRAATGGLASAGRRHAWATGATVAIACIGIVAIDVVGESREGLRADLSRTGKFFDVYLFGYTDPAAAAADREALLASPSVTGLATIESFRARVDGLGIAGISVITHKGGLATTIVEGRAPVGDDELVASAPFLRRLHRGVGDTVEFSGPAGTRRFRVVGAAALPYVASTAVIGEQVAVTAEAGRALGIEPEFFAIAADVARPALLRQVRAGYDRIDACDTPAILRILGVDRLEGPASGGVSLCVPRTDQRVLNLDELGALPGAAAGLFAVLGVAGLAYLLSASFRQARRDLAVLRVLGFTRRQSTTTVLVQAAAVALVGALLALPIGVALGRAAWRGAADGIGIMVVPEVSLAGTLGVAAGAVAVAGVLAIPFAARTVRHAPGKLLRTE
ncbi:MAG: hypothetical protein KY452_02515 [Actinobacteria bacterium]|nr:hypothetical protein [Actinomycetota bacterium]